MNKAQADHVPRRDAGIACVVSMAFGAVLTAIALVGSDVPLKCIEAGNVADWLAAAGTWIIGYAAWRVTRDAHFQRSREVAAAESKEREAKRSRLRDIRFRTGNATGLYESLATVLKQETPVNFATINAVLQVVIESLDPLSWNDSDRRYLDINALRTLAKFTVDIRIFLSTVKQFGDLVGEGKANFDARTSPAFFTVIDYAKEMSISGMQFTRECDRLYELAQV